MKNTKTISTFWLIYDFFILIGSLGFALFYMFNDKLIYSILFMVLYGATFIGTSIANASERISSKFDIITYALTRMIGYDRKDIDVVFKNDSTQIKVSDDPMSHEFTK